MCKMIKDKWVRNKMHEVSQNSAQYSELQEYFSRKDIVKSISESFWFLFSECPSTDDRSEGDSNKNKHYSLYANYSIIALKSAVTAGNRIVKENPTDEPMNRLTIG